ncbi:endonuclease 8-like 1 isoform X4 [Hippopotamus amphibius kiboko]|uniref:endonuclease 8-like 1 isoform X4 n=1 Tax=Hippopotamus amphibius kiboko TaxID=575201 RepID=UPI002599EE25|nr:endonuclease 8-like 1 isoform X4 [Hippopotamus amphibius kiboko]
MHTWPNLLSSSPTGPGHPSHRMPEGPELHLASHFVNEACRELVFGGCVEKSLVSHNPEVPFASSAYRISAIARGKELRLTLSPLPGAQPPREPLALVFRFGMTGSFQLVPSDALPPHAHLRFYTAPPGPRLALCFVDIRRFGRWDLGGTWQPGRGPCVLLEYEQFRENVLRNLADKAFDRPICEALLDQRFFNGIGNYLRAEILYRLRIPPFEKARSVLEALQQRRPVRVQGGTCTHLSVQADKGLGWVRCLQLSTGRSLLSFQPVSLSLQCVCGGGAGGQTNCLSPAKLRRGLFPKGSAAFRVALPHAVIQVLPLPLLQSPELTLSQKIRAKLQNPDLLELCHLVPKEVIQLGGSRTLGTQRTLHLQTRPLQGHEGHGEAFLSKLQPSSWRGPASNRTQKPPQSLRKGKGGEGNRQPQAAADPKRSRLTPHPWSLRAPLPLSRRVSLLASTPSCCPESGPV